jgi:hypothetical protein
MFSRLTAALVALIALVATSQSDTLHRVDWKFFAAGGPDGAKFWLFYAANEIRRTASGTLRVWTKSIDYDALDAAMTQDVFNDAIELALQGYEPPASKFMDLEQAKVRVIAAEAIASAGQIAPKVSILVELDCLESAYRYIKSVNAPGDGVPAAPTSGADNLLTVVCPTKSK